MSDLFVYVLQWPPLRRAWTTYLIPAVSVTLGASFLSEPAGPNLLGGAALILLGVALVQNRTSVRGHSASS